MNNIEYFEQTNTQLPKTRIEEANHFDILKKHRQLYEVLKLYLLKNEN
jgi:hypothetical protein